MAPNAKVAQAYRAMREIGISEQKVKPVLKKLLKLYEKNWELIEAENYRALADAIFEEEDTKEEELDQDGSTHVERPLKRICLRSQEGEASSCPINCETGLDGAFLKRPKEEQEELPSPPLPQQSQSTQKPPPYNLKNARTEGQPTSPGPISPPPASPNDCGIVSNINKLPVLPRPVLLGVSEPVQPSLTMRDESKSLSSQMHVRYKGKEPVSSHVASGERALVPVRSSNGLSLKNPASEPSHLASALIIPKEEPFIDGIPRYEVPIAVIHPDSLSKGDYAAANVLSSGRSDLQEPPMFPRVDEHVCDGNSLCKGDSAAENIGSSGGLDLQEPPVSTQVDEHICDVVSTLSSERKTSSELATVAADSPYSLEMASSTLGGVKISLSCNFALGSPNIHIPSPDELRELMEKRCLRSYKIMDPNFSVMKLMQDTCDCFLELVTNSSNEGHQTMSQ